MIDKQLIGVALLLHVFAKRRHGIGVRHRTTTIGQHDRGAGMVKVIERGTVVGRLDALKEASVGFVKVVPLIDTL